MALAIDTTPLATHCMPQVQGDLDKLSGYTRRFQIQKLCAHATVIHDAASTAQRLSDATGVNVAEQDGLDWQANQDEDLDDLNVFHHLQKQAKTSPLFQTLFQSPNSTNDTTTLVASCIGSLGAHRRPLSSYQRYSLRSSVLAFYNGDHFSHFLGTGSGNPNIIPRYAVQYSEWIASSKCLKIVGGENSNFCVVWHLQCDVADLYNQRPQVDARPGKRKQTAVNSLRELSLPAVEGNRVRKISSRFNGVRYRPNRRTWVAEMKPHGFKNKESFGDFKSEVEAARVADVAYYYYDKPELLNFPESLNVLRSRPNAPTSGEEKLKFIREQAKLMRNIASTLLTLVSSEVVESPPFQTSLENVDVDPSAPAQWLVGNSVQITEWGGVDDPNPALRNFENSSSQPDCEIQKKFMNTSSQPSYGIQSMWMNSLVMSPPVQTIPMPLSPSDFQDEVARALLEQQ